MDAKRKAADLRTGGPRYLAPGLRRTGQVATGNALLQEEGRERKAEGGRPGDAGLKARATSAARLKKREAHGQTITDRGCQLRRLC